MSISKRFIYKRNRYLSKFIFSRTLINGQVQERSWLIYFTNIKAIFCGPCKLFGEKQPLTMGYSDLSNVSQRVKEHEESCAHKTNVITYLNRCKVTKLVDDSLKNQIETKINYWRNVLKRVICVIQAWASRGLVFRGKDEKFGSQHNGNYMLLLVLVAEFDPFLKNHIEKHGNPGSGKISYLSSTVCKELIQLMSEQLLKKNYWRSKESEIFLYKCWFHAWCIAFRSAYIYFTIR